MHSITKNTTITSTLLALLVCLTGCGPKSTSDSTQVPEEKEVSKTTQVEVESTEAPSYALNINESGLALHGYDPVSYFSESGPEKGDSSISHEWAGATWNFASEENRQRFQESPEDFVPANGGYCTFGIYLNKKFDGDPKVFMENDGAVYLFLNEEVKEKFNQDTENNLKAIEGNWKVIKDKSPAELE